MYILFILLERWILLTYLISSMMCTYTLVLYCSQRLLGPGPGDAEERAGRLPAGPAGE